MLNPRIAFKSLEPFGLNMNKIYLVGGSVRDMLLGKRPNDFDYVAVGFSKTHLLNAGFQQVGADFPVFIHPLKKVEIALARTERKISSGHRGFEVNFDKNVKLIDDLKRRDFTINAIAFSVTGEFIDPYNGRNDLNLRVIRHVSDAFDEDPLRVLRGCRFVAQLGDFQFKVSPKTREKFQTMAPLTKQLSGERIINEILNGLQTDYPRLFLTELIQSHVLNSLFPSIRNQSIDFKTSQIQTRLMEWIFAVKPSLNCLNIESKKLKLPKYYQSRLKAVVTLARPEASSTPENILSTIKSLGWCRGDSPQKDFDDDLQLLDKAVEFPVKIPIWFSWRKLIRKVNVKEIVNRGYRGKDLQNIIDQERLIVLSTETSAPFSARGL